ncbi:MAG: hypothetical protein AAF399_18030 [Bacteroidota bacterium]
MNPRIFLFLLAGLSVSALAQAQNSQEWQWFLNGQEVTPDELTAHIFCLDRPDTLELWFLGEVGEEDRDSLSYTWAGLSLWGQIINQQAIHIGSLSRPTPEIRPAVVFTLEELGAKRAIPFGQLSTQARVEWGSLLVLKGNQAYESFIPPPEFQQLTFTLVRNCN